MAPVSLKCVTKVLFPALFAEGYTYNKNIFQRVGQCSRILILDEKLIRVQNTMSQLILIVWVFYS